MDNFYDRANGYGMQVNEYNGKYTLQAARQKEDKIYLDWVYLSKWDEATRTFVPDEKKRPMGIYLGDIESARKFLRWALNEFGEDTQSDDGQDIPF